MDDGTKIDQNSELEHVHRKDTSRFGPVSDQVILRGLLIGPPDSGTSGSSPVPHFPPRLWSAPQSGNLQHLSRRRATYLQARKQAQRWLGSRGGTPDMDRIIVSIERLVRTLTSHSSVFFHLVPFSPMDRATSDKASRHQSPWYGKKTNPSRSFRKVLVKQTWAQPRSKTARLPAELLFYTSSSHMGLSKTEPRIGPTFYPGRSSLPREGQWAKVFSGSSYFFALLMMLIFVIRDLILGTHDDPVKSRG